MLATSGIALSPPPQPYRGGREWLEATDPRTDFSRLLELTTSSDVQVRMAVASRPTLQMGLLATLAFDTHPDVRVAVAGSVRLNPVVAEVLLADRDWRVLRALAHNSATPQVIIEALCGAKRPEVRRAARRHLTQIESAPAQRHVANTFPILVQRP